MKVYLKNLSKWAPKSVLAKTEFKLYTALNKLKKQYDFIVLDECQSVTPANAEYFKRLPKMPHILAMTGFLSKDQVKKDILEKDLGLKILFKYGHTDAINDKLVSDYKINVMMVNLSKKKDYHVKTKTRDYMTSEESKYADIGRLINQAQAQRNSGWNKSLRIERQRFLHSLPSKIDIAKNLLFHNKMDRFICFSPTKKVAEEISDFYFHSGSEDDKNYQAFQNETNNVLSVVNKVSTGHTFHNMDGVILMGADSNQNGILSQKMARSFVWRKDYVSQIYILVAAGTQEEVWLRKSLEPYDMNKVEIVHPLKNAYI
jgi:superfamily II DNA or RNA helicase